MNEEGKRKVYHTDDPGGVGEEIVKEAIACPTCAARLAEQEEGRVSLLEAS
jgi:hypothetical protein